MAERCPNCGNAALEENSLFCNKCGFRLTENPPQKTVIISPAAKRPAAPPVAPPRMVEKPAAMIARPGYESGGSRPKKFLRFDLFVTKKFVSVIYVAGAVAITLLPVLALIDGPADTAAASAASASDSTSFVFWVLVLVVGNIAWRFLCEAAVATFRIHDSIVQTGELPDLTDPIGSGYETEMEPPEPVFAETVKCPHCSSIVTTDQLRECEYCGVTGCERCIRQMGLIKKHLTCRDCFESQR